MKKKNSVINQGVKWTLMRYGCFLTVGQGGFSDGGYMSVVT